MHLYTGQVDVIELIRIGFAQFQRRARAVRVIGRYTATMDSNSQMKGLIC